MADRGVIIPLSIHDAFIRYIPQRWDGNFNHQYVIEYMEGLVASFQKALDYAPGSELITADIKIIGPLDKKFQIPQIWWAEQNKKIDMEYSATYRDKRAAGDLNDLADFI